MTRIGIKISKCPTFCFWSLFKKGYSTYMNLFVALVLVMIAVYALLWIAHNPKR